MKAVFTLLILSLIIIGCEEKVIAPLDEAPYEVSFKDDLQPYFTSDCTGCHKSASSPAGLNLSEGDAYESITTSGVIDQTNSKQSSLYLYVRDGHQGKQDKTKASEILRWINDGANDD